MFEKILVPMDHSEHSQRAFNVATQIAKKFGAKITLIHVYSVGITPVVVPEPSTLTVGIPISRPEYISQWTEAAREAGSRILAEAENKAKAEKVEVDSMLREGHTVQEIVQASKEGNFDLIVMGARGVSHVREMLLGSVTDGVMHHATCPVLILRQKQSPH